MKTKQTLKQVAIEACRELSQWIYDGCSFAWPMADKIERRFRIQGTTDYFVKALKSQHETFLSHERAEHDNKEPNRLSYLHR